MACIENNCMPTLLPLLTLLTLLMRKGVFMVEIKLSEDRIMHQDAQSSL